MGSETGGGEPLGHPLSSSSWLWPTPSPSEVPGAPQGKSGPRLLWAATLAGAGTAHCRVFPKSTCFACSPEGPRPSHCPLPEARLELSGFRDLSQPSLEFSLSPNLHSLGPSLGLTWEPGMKAQGHPPWAAASKDDKYPLTQGIPRLSSPS